MLSTIITLFIIFYNAEIIFGNTRSLRAYQDVAYQDTISNYQSLRSSKSTSIAGCVTECMDDEKCGSFYFHAATGSCAMYTSRMSAVFSVISKTGWRFFHTNQGKFKWVRVMEFNATFNNIPFISRRSVCFIGGGNRSTQRKRQICRKLLKKTLSQCCIDYTSPEQISNLQLIA